MAAFDVNTDAAIQLTAKLEKLHRSAFPVAVRGTLNDAAFETKGLVPRTAQAKFTIRQRNLFRKFILVDKAKGFNTGAMTSQVGVAGSASRGGKVAQGLAAQERGGEVKSRKLLPHNMGRVSGSFNKKLRSKYHFNKINISSSGNRKKGSKYVLVKKGNSGTVFDTSRKGRLVPIYTFRPNNKTRLTARPFLRPSSIIAAKKMDRFYAKQAERQFKRLLK